MLFCVHTNLIILAPCSPSQIAKHLKKQKQELFIILSAIVKINLPFFHPPSVNTYVYMSLYIIVYVHNSFKIAVTLYRL